MMNAIFVSRYLTRLALLLCAAAAAFDAAGADAADDPLIVQARDVLPPAFFRSVRYDIDDEVRRAGYFYHFRVTSDYGVFNVGSIAMLRVRLHELLTIADAMTVLNKSSGDLNRAPDGRRGVGGDSIADIISDPLGTAGTLFGNLAHNFEETFAQTNEVDENGSAESFGTFEIDPGPHKRSAASQLDVDVYSSNAALQEILDRIADARSAGKLRGPVAATQAIPVGPPAFGSGLLDERLRSILKNRSAAEINGSVDARLEAAGVSRDVRARFRTNPAYSPRTRLYLVRYLAQLKQASGIGQVIRSANAATTEVDALAFVNLARMAAFHQLSGHPIARILTRRGFPIFITRDEVVVLALPVDYFDWSDDSAALAAALQRLAGSEGANSAALLLAGRADTQARTELASRNIALSEHYSF